VHNKSFRWTIPQLVEKFQQFPAGTAVTRVVAQGGEPIWEGSNVRCCTYIIDVEMPKEAAAEPTKVVEVAAGNRELIERLAREAGMKYSDHFRWWTSPEDDGVNPPELERFAALIAEECAKVADEADGLKPKEGMGAEEYVTAYWPDGGRRLRPDGKGKAGAAIRSKFSKG
jgi:hypothetical protein